MNNHLKTFLLAALLLAAIIGQRAIRPVALAQADQGVTSLVTQGNKDSINPKISTDSRYVAFSSAADNLIDGDTNGHGDVFVYDRQTGETILISRHSDGTQGNAPSYVSSISADGRFVVFSSQASNLVDGETKICSTGLSEFNCNQVYLHDSQTAETILISVNSDGQQGDGESYGGAVSADGRFVAFSSEAANLIDGDSNGEKDVFVHDRESGQTTRISVGSTGGQANGRSDGEAISADGRFVAFASVADNLIDGDTNENSDIFVHDRQTGETSLISRHSNGTLANDYSSNPTLSADGRFIAFHSTASNLVDGFLMMCGEYKCGDIFVHDRQTGETKLVSRHTDGTQGNGYSINPALSADGRYVAFDSSATNLIANDANGPTNDVFLHDRTTGETTLISRHTNGAQGTYNSITPSLSAGGSVVTFSSTDSQLIDGDTSDRSNISWDIFAHDRVVESPSGSSGEQPAQGDIDRQGTVNLISRHSDGTQGNGDSTYPSISADGRFVAFTSWADNLVSGDRNGKADVFLHDRLTGQTILVSRHTNSIKGNYDSFSGRSALSDNGRFITFHSQSTNLVDDNGDEVWADVFVHDRQLEQTTLVSRHSNGARGNGDSYDSHISADGRYVAFTSAADNLVDDDKNDTEDVFIHDRLFGRTFLVSRHSDGTQGAVSSSVSSLSADGRYVVFHSGADNLVDNDTVERWAEIFVHDQQTGETTLISRHTDETQGNNISAYASISGDGRIVAFPSAATNLVDNDVNGFDDVFLHNRDTGETDLVSRHDDGTQGNNNSGLSNGFVRVSADGRFVAYTSLAGNLVAGDNNGGMDVFLYDRQTGQTVLVSHHTNGTQGNQNSRDPSISGDGRFIAFGSAADNLVDEDGNGQSDIFVYEAAAHEPAPGDILDFAAFPLSEALLLYIDEGGNLALENVDTGATARLTSSGDINNFSIAPTRDRILYSNQSGRSFVLELEFSSDGFLVAQTLPVSLPYEATDFRWNPDGERLVFKDADFRWWIFDVTGSASPIRLPEDTHIINGWSHDGQWLSYCATGGNRLEIVDSARQVITVDRNIECERVWGGEGPIWSPGTPQLAYARGLVDLDSNGLNPVIYNASSGDYIELPIDRFVMGWSPDGRYLALAEKWSSARQEVVESITIANDQGHVIEELPGYSSATLGEVGWVRATEEELIFGRYKLGDRPGESESVIDALFGISRDGSTRWWGLVGDASFVVLCTDGDGADTDVYHSLHTSYPDETYPTEFPIPQPGIRVLLSPDGSRAVIDAYEGGEAWRRMLMRCEGGEALINSADVSTPHLLNFSADSRRILWYESTGGEIAPLVYHIDEGAKLLPTTEKVRRSATWLITPDAAPSVTEVNAIAGRVTDHTGAPIPGARVRAAGPGDPLETTTGNDGRYRFEEPPAGEYTVTADLVGYVFSTPGHVTIPPNQLNVDFAAEPPAAYTLTGRVADCAGRPVSGATVSFDPSVNGARTNADGRYTIEGLERKSYTLSAAAEGYDFVPATRAVHLARYAAGETLTVDFTATTSGSDEFCIPHLEVIQVVQDEFNSAPIIADKPALLRAYVHCPACDPDETITGTLEAFRPEDGTTIPAPGAPLTADVSNPGPEFTLNTFRGDLERSLNFLLPPEWLEEGDTRFRVSANGASATLDVAFEPGKPLRIYYMLFDYHESAPNLDEPTVTPPLAPIPGVTPLPPAFPPNQAVIDEGFDALRTMLPIASADLTYVSQLSVVQLMNIPFNQDGTPRMNAERYLDVLSDYWLRMEQAGGWRDGLAPDRLFGWVTTSAGTLKGIAYSRFLSNPGSVAAARADEQTHSRLQYSIGAFTLVHELGHLLDDEGLEHTPFINETQGCFAQLEGSAAEDYPDFLTEGSIGDWGIHISSATFELLNPHQTFDIMSYCVPYWISLHNYKRFHEGFMPVDAAPAAQSAAPEQQLLISGRVISSTQTAEIDPVFQIQAVAPPSPDTTGDTCVELRDATDVMQVRRCFAPVFREGITGGPTDAAGFTLAVPWVEGTTSVVVTRDDRELGRVAASPALPAVDASTIAGELSADGQLMTVRWDGNDPDDDALVYTLSLRGERGLIPLAFDIREEEVSFDTRQLPGDEPLHIVIEASDGFHSTRAESVAPMVFPSRPPTVSIAPLPEGQLTAGRPFWAFGAAHDVEDGSLPEEALVWSVDGREVGRGPQLFATLPAGEYTLTLTATDSDGGQAAAEWPLSVRENSVPEDNGTPTGGDAATLRRLIGWVAVGSGVALVLGLAALVLERRRS